MSSQADLPIQHYRSFDGAELAWREMGEGRAVVLLHGFFSDALTNWVRYGHAAAIVGGGVPGDHARPACAWVECQAA